MIELGPNLAAQPYAMGTNISFGPMSIFTGNTSRWVLIGHSGLTITFIQPTTVGLANSITATSASMISKVAPNVGGVVSGQLAIQYINVNSAEVLQWQQ